jgi:hypothetical protein
MPSAYIVRVLNDVRLPQRCIRSYFGDGQLVTDAARTYSSLASAPFMSFWLLTFDLTKIQGSDRF